jgi:membrane protein implicated in regulation of membrane protease activity
LKRIMNFFSHLLRPARLGPALVIIVFSVILAIAMQAALLGLPAILILTSWFFKYAYILFDHTVWGYEEPPALDIQMLNPLDEQRPLAQLLILGLIYLAVKFTATAWGAPPALVLAALAAFAFPASVAVLGLERRIVLAIYPVAIARMIGGLGSMYLLVLAVIAAYLIGIGILLKWVSFLPLELALTMFGILSIFSVLGGALYERRNELGIETRRSPERTAELERREEERENHTLVTEAYGHMRAGSHTKAWAVLQHWLASRGHLIDDYQWLCERAVHWHDRRYANRLGDEYLDRLLALKEHGRALDVVRQRLQEDPAFRPKTAAATLRLAELAAQGGIPGIARALLSDFGTRFPGDAGVGAAQALAERLTR